MLSCFQSTLYVKEVQSDKGVSGALVELEVGVDGRRAQKIKIETNGKNDDSVVLDMPEGLLVGYQVFGPQDNGYKYEKDVSVTPFKRTVKLLKTVTFILIGKISLNFFVTTHVLKCMLPPFVQIDVNIHICLSKYLNDENGSEKDAVVETILEYEWASQDDSHEIVPVDYKGDIRLKRIPSPSPGEALNVTLLSRLGSQVYLNGGGQDTYHRPLAEHFSKIHYHENGPVHLKLCHEQETVSSFVAF